MKILHVLPTREPEYGGPVKVADALSQISQSKGIETFLYPENDYNNQKSFLYYPGIYELRQLKRMVKSSDIVHIHGLWTVPTSYSAYVAAKLKIPYVVTPHGMLDKWSLRRSRLKKFMYSLIIERRNLFNSSALHFLNKEEFEEAKEFGIESPAFVIPNGVDLNEFEELSSRSDLEVSYPELKDKTRILFLGRIHPKKGFDLLMPAFAKANKEFPNLHLVIAGPDEGGYKNTVVKMVNEYSLQNSVTFTGFVDGEEKKALLGGSDFFVLTSYQEGDSVAVKEALASGLPVVITKACHLQEIDQFKAGIVVDTDIEDINKAITKLSGDADLRTEMSRNALTLIKDKFSWEVIGDNLVEVYNDILRKRFSSQCWRM